MLFELLEALQAGKSLKDPAKWKNRATTINLLVVILGAVVSALRLADIDIPLDDEQLKMVAEGLAVFLGLANSYMHLATSTKVGKK